jgi:hypothetical protein
MQLQKALRVSNDNHDTFINERSRMLEQLANALI